MHLAAESALYGGRSRLGPGLVVALTGLALAANLVTGRPQASALLAALGGLAWFALGPLAERRHQALSAAVVFALVALGLGLGRAGDPRVWLFLAKAAAGLAWMLFLGSALSWPELKRWLRRLGVAEALLDGLEEPIVQGVRLLGVFERRRDALALRSAGSPRRLTDSYSRILAGGLEAAFEQGIRHQESRMLRAAPRPEARAQAPPGSAVLEWAGVEARYEDGTWAIRGLDLRLAPGEWIALAGPSGSGKSSLLRLAAGLLAPTAGGARRFGRALAPGRLRSRLDGRLALVFQNPDDQILGSTPLEDLLWGLRQRGYATDPACARAEELLAALGLGPLAHRPVHRLSFGERKRLAFAAALAAEPELLLCDEPTSGLDPVAALGLVTVLEEAAARRPDLAVVWATHDLAHLPAAVSRVVLLEAGRQLFDGPPAEALSPSTLIRAGLLPGPRDLPLEKIHGR